MDLDTLSDHRRLVQIGQSSPLNYQTMKQAAHRNPIEMWLAVAEELFALPHPQPAIKNKITMPNTGERFIASSPKISSVG